jgi:integrase
MASKIDTELKRKKLEVRHYPHWEKVAKGRFIGFRKGKKNCAWMARTAQGGDFKYNTFENSGEWNYEDALEAASDWFVNLVNLDASVRDMNVKDAVNHYEKRMGIEKNPRNATENAQRVRKHLSANLGTDKLSKLTKKQVLNFRDSMVSTGDDEEVRKSKVSANRVLNVFKAVLNLAYEDKLIGSRAAWDSVKSFEDVGEARKLYLSDEQVKAFIAKTSGAFRDLCMACILTGNRVGSLTGAIVRDFDKQEGTIRLTSRKGGGKVKTWDCYLRDDALAFFKGLAKDRLPGAHLLSDDNGEPWQKNGYRRSLLAAKMAAKMPADFDLYAFRHYHISKALLAGIQAQVIAENCGTSVRMLEKHYAKFVGSDRRAMMNSMTLGI